MDSEIITLRDEISKVARHVAFAERCPILWDHWVIYFLEVLESESFHLDMAGHPEGIEKSYKFISEAISERLEKGSW